ncbi:unnamed protein product, partial [Ectocarpus sp. 12 AP-2014]
LAATITAHHLVINRNHILVGGIKPHYYCLPVAKREAHRKALLTAAASGDKRFFLGTDSAPHLDEAKESACGCAGCFTATNAVAVVAEAFDSEGAMDKLEGFLCRNGADFYRLPVNEGTITLTRSGPQVFPGNVPTPEGPVTVFDPARPIHWAVSPDT